MRTTLAGLLVLFGSPACWAGLLGAGFGHGSCAAFPFRSDDLDHVGGCPRWAECCTEYGYCHSRESWEEGNFRDCNGESNGTPLPGSVIRLEAAEAAKGNSEVTAEILGIAQDLWQAQIQKATTLLSISSLSSTSSTGFAAGQAQSTLSSQSAGSTAQSGFSSGQSQSSISSQSQGSFSNSDLIAQILLAIQPQISQAVQSAVQSNQATAAVSNSNRFNSQQQTQQQQQQLFLLQQQRQQEQQRLEQQRLEQQQLFLQQQQQQQQQFSSEQQQFSSGQQQFSSGQQINSGFSVSGDFDTAALVAQVVAQLTPQIAAAVSTVVTEN